jgi:hypothetical protein
VWKTFTLLWIAKMGPLMTSTFPRGADATAAPAALTDSAIELGSLADRGPNALTVREQLSAGDVTSAVVLWIRPHCNPVTDVIPLMERLDLPSRELTTVPSSGLSNPAGYRPGAIGQLQNMNVIFVNFNSEVFCLYNLPQNQGNLFNCIPNTALSPPAGVPWTSERVGDALYVSVRRSDNSGSIFKAVEADNQDVQLQSWLNVISDDNPLSYAADMATDGSYSYYTTASNTPPFAVMRANTETLVVERLVELEAEGAGIVVDNFFIYYAIPELNRIERIARP